MSAVSGIFLLDKPSGLSSNAALQRVKQLYGARKAGHAGSLDPLASGMLPVCLGEATKVAGALLDSRKQYLFTIELGARTASGDLETPVSERREVPELHADDIQRALLGFVGTRTQVPPMHSAIKQGGRRLYELARQGIEVDRSGRNIRIEALELQSWSPPRLALRVICSKGTYIRVLAEEIAQALGTCGHVVLLHRSWTSPFEREAMTSLDRLQGGTPGERTSWLLATDRALADWPRVDLAHDDARRILQGQILFLQPSSLPAAQVAGEAVKVRLYGPDALFLGMGELGAEGRLEPHRLMAAASGDLDAGKATS